MSRKVYIFLCIVCEVASHFSALRKFWVVNGIVPVVEGLNMQLNAVISCNSAQSMGARAVYIARAI